MNQPGIAAVLSLFIPGVGQVYNGDFLRAIFWFIFAPSLWFASAGLLGWVAHLIAAYTAYYRGKKYMEGRLP
jgi:TM2 domain-containing membrane protein YozV